MHFTGNPSDRIEQMRVTIQVCGLTRKTLKQHERKFAEKSDFFVCKILETIIREKIIKQIKDYIYSS